MDDNDDEDDDEDDTPAIRRSFFVNLPTPPKEQIIVFDEHTAPHGAGLLFQYVDELAKYDRSTVPEVINRHFLGCLSDDEEDALEVFEGIVRSWGVLQNTEWGNQITHIAKCIDISLRCQAVPHVMITAGRYDGVFMRGGGFEIRINGTIYKAASKDEIQKHIKALDFHGNALWDICQMINFIDEDTRVAAWRTMRSMKKLKEYVGALGISGGTSRHEIVERKAKFLCFPDDRELDANAFNVALVLSIIADPAKDLNELPYLHHSVLFSNKRSHIAWSAFGGEAPSFRVPGGKVMHLGNQFKVTSAKLKNDKGPSAHRDVTKIGAQMVALPLALQHLDSTLEEKTIWNPFGNATVNAAASHMNKEFAGDSCTMIVEAFRKAARVSVVDSAGKGTKRKAEDDVGGSKKKGRATGDF